MFREDYIRDMDRVGPDGEQLERLLERLNDEEEKTMKKRIFPTALLVAAVCAALGVTALAASPTVRDILSAAWGSFEPYRQTVEDVAAVDQGIRVKLSSVLADENGGMAVFEVTDLEGDRLDENTQADIYMASRRCLTGWSGEEKTLIYSVPLSAFGAEGVTWDEERMATVEFREFAPGQVELGRMDLPWDQITGETLRSKTVAVTEEDGYDAVESREKDDLAEGGYTWMCRYKKLEQDARRVLLPGQNPIDIGNEYVSVSSVGFDEEGAFHIQFELLGGARTYNRYGLSAWETTWPEGMMTFTKTLLMLEEGRYIDLCYPEFTPELWGQFRINGWDGVVYTAPHIPGSWTLEFPVPLTPVRQVEVPGGNEFCGISVDRLTFSVMGFGFEYHRLDPEGTVHPGWQPTFYLSDGRVVQFHKNVRGEGNRIYFPNETALDPAQVTAVAIGQWYIPVEEDTARPGYWLEAMPQAGLEG